VLYGKDYWEPLRDFIQKTMYELHAAINKEDMELFVIVDSVDEAYEYITKNVTC
jgi:predicted Rossmann-fold nucleotide-binding protein